MGRLTPSVGQPPASFRRAAKAKRAKSTITQVLPTILPAHPRASRGIENAHLIVNPGPVEKFQGERRHQADLENVNARAPANANHATASTRGPRLRLLAADTLTAAHSLVIAAPSVSSQTGMSAASVGNSNTQVAILNMASPLSPGGGFFNGASSQEETLCMHTSLLPSLKDHWYRLPELGAIYTPDVLVFREPNVDGQGDAEETMLDKNNRWFVDCISAAMLRNPETERDASGHGHYVDDKDRQLVKDKMRMVMRVCQAKGIKKVVLGAWGCGAYGNPVGEIAAAWRRVLIPPANGNLSKKKQGSNRPCETWSGVEEVVFAIKDPGMASAFATAFGEGLEQFDGSCSEAESSFEDEDQFKSQNDPGDEHKAELQMRIEELRMRMERTTNPQLKAGLNSVLAGLTAQLNNVGTHT